MDLNIAGCELWIMRAFALDHRSSDRDDKLSAQTLRLRVSTAGIFFVQNDLRYSLAVAKIDKRKRPKIALLRHPAHQHDLLAYVHQTQLTAGVRTLQTS